MFDELFHYGTPRHSGRYPWGSGKNPYQHGSADFLSRVEAYEKEGLSEKQIAEAMGISTTELRDAKRVAKDTRDRYLIDRVRQMRDRDNMTWQGIADELGLQNESSARHLYNKKDTKVDASRVTADKLEEIINEKGIIDIGEGVELELRISPQKLRQAALILEDKGYVVHNLAVPQVTNPGQQTNLKVLCPPGTTLKDAYAARDAGEIYSVVDYAYTQDGGQSWNNFKPPVSIDSSRIMINYADTGDGGTKDGLIELRRGVDDISLGNSSYAQVRIAVDDKYYLKGMAVYSDNLPPGVDIIFNTSKTSDKPMDAVFKKMKIDPATGEIDKTNPFGALIKRNNGTQQDGQRMYQDANGEWHQSVINKVRDEGDWSDWSNTLASQMLSKQNKQLIKQQLDLSYADKLAEYEEIKSLTNPTVKRYFLNLFASDCDASAAELDAIGLPRQKYQVLLPLNSVREDQIYAPNYDNGEKVALIRYPHGGIFEIPILTVNNKNKEGRTIIGKNGIDAVGINYKTAHVLSGADFDGDTVLVIPVGKHSNINNRPPLSGLVGFEPKELYATKEVDTGKKDEKGNPIYAYYNSDGKRVKIMKNTQTEMGKITNLITDMSLAGASDEEMERAVRHSMVVIDAEKHKLDYKKSEEDNGIAALKKKYQGSETGGASTIISRSNADVRVDRRVGSPVVNLKENEGKVNRYGEPILYDPNRPEGSLIWKAPTKQSDREYEKVVKNPETGQWEGTGKIIKRQTKVKGMSTVDDAYDLTSHTNNAKEALYADYANKLKGLANSARVEEAHTPRLQQNASAKKVYAKEVESLDYKLSEAVKQSPRERRAQIIAHSIVKAKKESNPEMTKSEEKKIKQRALEDARQSLGAHSVKIEITDREWEAIQAGAISDTKLEKILSKTDPDELRKRATPRGNGEITPAQASRIRHLAQSGYTNKEIANIVGTSPATVGKYVKGE